VILDKNSLRRAPADRLDPNRTGSREYIQKARSGNGWPQYVEERLAQIIAGRTQRRTFQALQDSTSVRPGDDSHNLSRLKNRTLSF
jgi:hypothetical protein